MWRKWRQVLTPLNIISTLPLLFAMLCGYLSYRYNILLREKRARASLRNRHQGPSIMGFEDEVEQSLPRPCRQTNGGSKRTCELTSSIVPRGTSFPPVRGARVSFYW